MDGKLLKLSSLRTLHWEETAEFAFIDEKWNLEIAVSSVPSADIRAQSHLRRKCPRRGLAWRLEDLNASLLKEVEHMGFLYIKISTISLFFFIQQFEQIITSKEIDDSVRVGLRNLFSDYCCFPNGDCWLRCSLRDRQSICESASLQSCYKKYNAWSKQIHNRNRLSPAASGRL